MSRRLWRKSEDEPIECDRCNHAYTHRYMVEMVVKGEIETLCYECGAEARKENEDEEDS